MSLFEEWVVDRDVAPDEDDHLDYRLWGCLHCKQPQLWQEPVGSGGSEERQRLWPQVAALAEGIPASIAREMMEARACFDAKLYTAAAVMVRRTLEGMCIEQGTQKKALFQALQELRDNGKIEGRLFEWAQALRVLGNQGAHFSKEAVSRKDAADALSLAEALLNYIYVFTAKYEEFQKRRQAPAH
ncbi:DUF4145 domain-containing protein [Streptomyces sp. V1I6]|uniref:DUF4145 domain-containing protein n=1 Tax=Streptomyces sp. V1I6 TaxID=3042273 RepID=UPI0027834D2C|nr:DUF4145 domain-containing protein [Streptomyces sp. V1I6]MDQ0843362.1 hypothetical protein [Streptomyces sp. V1I6]